jgi:hypothetical protein
MMPPYFNSLRKLEWGGRPQTHPLYARSQADTLRAPMETLGESCAEGRGQQQVQTFPPLNVPPIQIRRRLRQFFMEGDLIGDAKTSS